MKVSNKTRSQVCKIAHSIRRKLECTLSIAFKKAWQILKLGMIMKKRAVNVGFTKVDGTFGAVTGTLKGFKGQVCDLNVFRFLDVNTNSIKCLKIENLITFF